MQDRPPSRCYGSTRRLRRVGPSQRLNRVPTDLPRALPAPKRHALLAHPPDDNFVGDTLSLNNDCLTAATHPPARVDPVPAFFQQYRPLGDLLHGRRRSAPAAIVGGDRVDGPFAAQHGPYPEVVEAAPPQ